MLIQKDFAIGFTMKNPTNTTPGSINCTKKTFVFCRSVSFTHNLVQNAPARNTVPEQASCSNSTIWS